MSIEQYLETNRRNNARIEIRHAAFPSGLFFADLIVGHDIEIASGAGHDIQAALDDLARESGMYLEDAS